MEYSIETGDMAASLLEARREAILRELSDSLRGAGTSRLFPAHAVLFGLVMDHVREPRLSRILEGVGKVRGLAGPGSLVSGQFDLWAIAHRAMQAEALVRDGQRDRVPPALALVGELMDGLVGALLEMDWRRDATLTASGWETLTELGRARRELRTFTRIIRGLQEAPDRPGMFQVLEEGLMGAFHLRSLAIVWVNHEAGMVEIIQGSPGDHQVGLQIPLSHPDILCEVARTGKREVVDGWDPRYYERIEGADGDVTFRPVPRDFNQGATACFVPILARGRVIGVLATGSRQVDRGVTLRELARMEPFLDQVGLTLSIQDEIANRRWAEEAMRESESRYRRLVDLSPDAVYVMVDERVAFANPAGARLLGAPGPEALIGMAAFDFIHPDYRELTLKLVRKVLVEQTVLTFVEQPLIRLDGQEVWVEATAGPFIYQGRPAIQALLRDITERKEAEKRLAWLASIPAQSPNPILEVDLEEGRVVYLNSSAEALFPSIAKEGLSHPILEGLDVLTPQSPNGGKESAFREVRFGDSVYMQTWTLPEGGHIRVYLVDITERIRAEEERVRLSMAVEQAAEAIVMTDLDGTIVYVNPAFERVSGYSPEEVVGKTPAILRSGRHDKAFYAELWETLAQGKVWQGRFVNRRKDGGLFQEESVISPVRDALGRVTHYVAVKRDVTQEVALEDQLRQAQKLEAIGTLAGGIAHDFNNLLTGIIGFAQLALMEDLTPGVRECISRIPDQGRRAANLIGQLLTFSRRDVVNRLTMDLLPLVKETVKMLQRTILENIQVRLKAGDSVRGVFADPTQMQQVLMNLCVNAGHAMPEGGELTVGLEDVTLDEAYCQQRVGARPGPHVCLWVKDTGVGMTPEVMAHIFEPFFTTKEVGKGTGLGLSTVYGIVKGHEGHLRVESEVGKGTEFRAYFPAVGIGRPEAPAAHEGAPPRGHETVLLVEDEARVLAMGQRVLERQGYTVLTATDGEEGLRVYRERAGEIALVLTDMVMPKMGGEALYLGLREIDPRVRVVIMTGYSLKEDLAGLRERGIRGVVQKPFDVGHFARTVRQAIDEKA